MIKKYFPSIVLLVTLCFFSCTQVNDTSLWVAYNETKCADAWDQSNIAEEEELEQTVVDYLSSQNLNTSNSRVEFNESLRQDCEACSCTSGRVIWVEIDDSFVDELEALGFY